jgi:hypothetical protein
MSRMVLLLFILLVSALARADPPPFGTELQQWDLHLPGASGGQCITWVRDAEMFYFIEQTSYPHFRVWRLDPTDPEGSVELVPWTFANLGSGTDDIPWCFAWDNDSGCFWVSQLVDGDIYGGCYLLRHVWKDSAWVWGGTARDSWLVGISRNGGGLRCGWLAGFDKWYGGGYFVGASIYYPGPDTLGLPLFCPYAKTELGRIRLETAHTVRGCALVPWDSAYILAWAWDDTLGVCKYDTTGRLLQSAPDLEREADMSLMWPQHVYPDDTVCVYSIHRHNASAFQRVSTGMLWSQLPSAFEHSVGPQKVLAPVGFADSGQEVVPELVVRNDAVVTADSVSVHFLIDDEADRVIYHDSIVVSLASWSTDTLELASWTATGRDSMEVTAWTYWIHDRHRTDDTLFRKFLVRVKDIGITAVNEPVPGDTIAPGWLRPRCQIRNHGNVTVTFPLVSCIDNWQDTVMVVDLTGGGTRTVTAADSWETVGDTLPHAVSMSCTLDSDQHPEDNDTAYSFWVRSPDVEIEAILAPVDTLLVNDTVRPIARVANRGWATAEFWMYFMVTDSLSARVYSDSVPIVLPVGMRTTAEYSSLAIGEAGEYTASCSAYLGAGHTPAISHEFRVIDPVGVHEQCPMPATFGITGVRPNPFVSGTVVRFGLSEQNDVEVVVFSADGRRVKELVRGVLGPGYHLVVWDGKDDIGRIVSRGVYCLRLAASGHVVNRRIVKLE